MYMRTRKLEAGWQAMAEAGQWLQAKGVAFDELTSHHIKIGPVNFWPRKGTIMIDGEEQRRPERGLAGLEAILIEHRFLARPSDLSITPLTRR